MIIVGSTAAKHWWKDWRDPSDLDVWIGNSELPFAYGDIHVIPNNILNLVPNESDYASPDALYTIKCSHLGWDNPMWDKHKRDIIAMKNKGCSIIPELYAALVEFWKEELNDKSFLSLKQNKEEFFTDNVEYIYDHDMLHELVSYPNAPMYSRVLKDGEAVLVDREKFESLCHEDKVRMFREEITVIACERWLLNPYWQEKGVSWYKAYTLSLKKTIVSLTKNWATDFIVQHLEEFVNPDYSYFKHLMEELNIMSNVDLTVFQEIADEQGKTLDRLIFDMAEGDLCLGDEACSVDFPERGQREFDDPSLRQEREAYWEIYRKENQDFLDSIGYEHLEQEGGGEGGSEYCYGVFKLGDKVYRAEYSYFSYNGHEYDDIAETLREVKPVEKTITVYE